MNTALLFFRKLVSAGRPGLREYEMACLKAVGQLLVPPCNDILEQQFSRRDLIVNRSAEDRFVVLFFLLADREELPLMPNRSPRLTAATVSLVSAQNGASTRFQCDVIFHRGRVFSLEFQPSPRKLEGRFSVGDVEMRADLSAQEAITTPGVAAGPLLGELQRSVEISEIRPPADDSTRATFSQRFSRILPEDYFQLVSETDGFLAGQWEFYGTRVRRMPAPGQLYLVVAEAPQLVLCAKEEEQSRQLYLYDSIDEEETPYGQGIVRVLTQAISHQNTPGE